MFKSLMASIGIGNAKIDTHLDRDVTTPGSIMSGVICLKGGDVEQTIETLVLELYTVVEREYEEDGESRTSHEAQILHTHYVGDSFVIAAGEERELRFDFPMPLNVPVTIGRAKPRTWIRTRADVSMAIDPKDKDALTVRPARIQEDTLAAMEELGFRLVKSDVEWRPKWRTGQSFAQEFEFKPTSSDFRHLEEVEIVFIGDGDGYNLLIQRDRSARGLMGMLAEATGTDESWHMLEASHDGLEGPGIGVLIAALGDILS